MPLPPELAAWLADQGHDAVHAAGLGFARTPDIAILARAKREGRTIITADLDYPRLLALTQASDPSLILFRGGNWSNADIVARMGQILEAFTAIELAHSIIIIDRHRVRRRSLPITL